MDGRLAIVLEYAYRGTMETRVERHGRPDHEFWIWRTIYHISSALNYLHNLKPQHVLHRDLKPVNVLGLSNTEKRENRISWKLADFGIAQLLNKDAQGKYYAESHVGYKTYMAPEVCSPLISFFSSKSYLFCRSSYFRPDFQLSLIVQFEPSMPNSI